jgi:hypothetical protein
MWVEENLDRLSAYHISRFQHFELTQGSYFILSITLGLPRKIATPHSGL